MKLLDLNYSTEGDRGPSAFAGYERYRLWCDRVLGVHPASFAIWRQIEGWLVARGRFAVLNDLCFDRRSIKEQTSALEQAIMQEESILA
jgi:hypothetical protein